ncbi:uncharacterized protein LOC142334070 [Lycorma delicatula]|uniref:uncharacterized protein LOC142334070 n=1 Tax=Lycorma delicatula TaxID=130591 RepID=UPI003F51114C
MEGSNIIDPYTEPEMFWEYDERMDDEFDPLELDVKAIKRENASDKVLPKNENDVNYQQLHDNSQNDDKKIVLTQLPSSSTNENNNGAVSTTGLLLYRLFNQIIIDALLGTTLPQPVPSSLPPPVPNTYYNNNNPNDNDDCVIINHRKNLWNNPDIDERTQKWINKHYSFNKTPSLNDKDCINSRTNRKNKLIKKHNKNNNNNKPCKTAITCNTMLKMLDAVHHAFLWLATGAFRSSPVISLLVDCSGPSLWDRQEQLLISYFAHLKGQPIHHPAFDSVLGDLNLEAMRTTHVVLHLCFWLLLCNQEKKD